MTASEAYRQATQTVRSCTHWRDSQPRPSWLRPARPPAPFIAQLSPAQSDAATSRLAKVGKGPQAIVVRDNLCSEIGRQKSASVDISGQILTRIAKSATTPKRSKPRNRLFRTALKPASPVLAEGWDTPPQTNDYDRASLGQDADGGGWVNGRCGPSKATS